MKTTIREANESEIKDILKLYAQPDMDDGKVLSVVQAEKVFIKMKSSRIIKCL